jgi:hypothetical protein
LESTKTRLHAHALPIMSHGVRANHAATQNLAVAQASMAVF